MKKLITERNVEKFRGMEIDPKEYIITPLAKDRFKELGIKLLDRRRDRDRVRDPASHFAFAELKDVASGLYGEDKGEELAEKALELLRQRYLLAVLPNESGTWEVRIENGKIVEVRRKAQ